MKHVHIIQLCLIVAYYASVIHAQVQINTEISPCSDSQPCPNTRNVTKTGDNGDNNNKKDNKQKPDLKKEKYLLVPPFLIGAATVIVVYLIFHCIYVHCYTEQRVQNIVRRTQKPPTIVIHGDSNAEQQPFMPMVKMEGAYGKTELVQTQPFLVCQPMETEEEHLENTKESKALSRNSSLRKSIQSLQVPNLFRSKSKRGSTASETGSLASPSSEGKPNLERTRASICFVPVGKTINDSSNSNTEWTPLQGFVYSSFVLSRNASYKHACLSDASINSEGETTGSYIVLPRKASYCPSLSQSSQASISEEQDETILESKKANGTMRNNSRVSFNFNIHEVHEEENEYIDTEVKEDNGEKTDL